MAHPKIVGRVSHHLMRVSKTIHADMQQTLHSVRGIVSNQTGSIGPSNNGGDRTDSRPSHGYRSHIPRYVSDDEMHHMNVEDLRSLYFECKDYIHGTDVATRECGYHTNYVDSTYDMEHGQASFNDAIVDDACRDYVTSTSMPTEVQVHMHFETPICFIIFLESSVATTYERVGGAGPSREFEEPWVDLTFDLTQRWPSYTGPKIGVQIKHSEQSSVNFPSSTATPEVTACPNRAPVVSQTHDSMTSPLGVEMMTYPHTTPMASVPESVLGSHTHDPMTSPLGLEAVGIDSHRVIGRRSQQTDEDLEDGNRSQRLRHEIDTEDIVPPRDSISC
eukprot:Gb_25600 [translate_table: standard]